MGGQLSQQEFFRIFLVSVQNSLTTNQRLSDVEKKLEETEARVEKLEVTGDSVSIAATEPEKPAEEAPAEEAPAEEATPVAEEAAEEQMRKPTLHLLLKRKKNCSPESQGRGLRQVENKIRRVPDLSAPEYEGFPSSFSHTTYAGKIRKMPACILCSLLPLDLM